MATRQQQLRSVSPQLARPPMLGRPGAAPRRAIKFSHPPVRAMLPTQAPQKEEQKDLGWLRGAIRSGYSIAPFIGSIVAAAPTLIGKAAQTVGGIGETAFDVATNVIDKDLYTSRREADFAKGREMGLKGAQLATYGTQRAFPLISAVIPSMAATGGSLAELATRGTPGELAFGRYDYGEPGLDYATSLRRGQLGAKILEDLGNVMLAGRLAGAGSLTAKAGSAASKAGMPRLGSALRTTGYVAESPIGATAQGTARLLGRALPQSSRFGLLNRVGAATRAAGAGGLADPSQASPFRTFGQEFVAGRRAEAGQIRQGLFAERANLEQVRDERQAMGLPADPATALRLDELDKQIERQTVRTAERKLATKAYRQDQRQMENFRNFWKQRFTGLDQKGPVAASVKQLERSATKARKLSETAETPAERQGNAALADLYEKQAAAKKADEQTGRMANREYINDTFAAGVIVESGQIDVVLREIERGILTPDQIFDALLPKETAAYLRDSGYTVTPGALQKAIDYAEGRADIVDQVSIEAGTYLIREFSDQMTQARQTGRGTVRGAASPFEPGNYPLPEYFLGELAKRSRGFQFFLNSYIGAVIEAMLPELRQSLGEEAFGQLNFENVPPAELFTFFANTPKDSGTYALAYNALAQAFDELMTSPDQAKFPEGITLTDVDLQNIRIFLTEPMIFPAPARIAGGVERTLQRGAVSRDIGTIEPLLRDLTDNYPDVLPGSLVTRINDTLESLSKPGQRFDLDTLRSLENEINQTINAIVKERAGTQEQLGVLGERRQQLLGRQQVVQNLLREAQIFVENVVRNPEQFFPTETAEVARLRGVAAEAQAGLEALGEPEIRQAETQTPSVSKRLQRLMTTTEEPSAAPARRPFRVASEIEADTRQLEQRKTETTAEIVQVERAVTEAERRLAEAESLTPDDIARLEADRDLAANLEEEFPYRKVDKAEVDRQVEADTEALVAEKRNLQNEFELISKNPLLDRRDLREDLVSAFETGLGAAENSKLYKSFIRRWVAPARASYPSTRRVGDPTPFGYDEVGSVINEVFDLSEQGQRLPAEAAWQELARRWARFEQVKKEIAELRRPEARESIAQRLQDEADGIIDSERQRAFAGLDLVDEYGLPRTAEDYGRILTDAQATDLLRNNVASLRTRLTGLTDQLRQIDEEIANNARDLEEKLLNQQRAGLRLQERQATQQAEGLVSANLQAQTRGVRGMLRGVGAVKTPKTISNAIANIDKRIAILNERLNKVGAFGNFEQQLKQLVEGVKSGLLSLEYINDPDLASLLQSYGIDSIPKLEQLIDDAFDKPLSTKKLNDLLKERDDLLQEQQSMPVGTKKGVLQAQFRQPLEADQARMVAEQVDNEAKTATLREEFATEDAALAEAQAIPGQATALSEQLAQPVGPLLVGERQIPYIPAGLGRGVEQSFGVATELVAEAMAPETVGGFEKIRTGTMVPYTPGQYANRIDQILNVFTRNVVVQNFIRNQEFVSTVADKFTPEQLQALRDEATRRNPETFGADPDILQRRIDAEYQNLLAQEIRKMGLEPISPVQMPDPLDIYAERAALGDLSETVKPSDINENTLLMTEGIRAGLAAEFAPKASTRVPERIQRALKTAQRKTGSWKGVVLPLSLRWQVGDAMGNILNAWVRGDVPPSELVRYANMAYDMMRESQTMDGGQLANRRQLMFSGTLQDTVNNPFLALLESYGLQSSGLKQSDLRSMMTNDQPDLFSVRLQGGLLNRTAAGRGYNRFRTGAFAFNEFQNRLAREAVAMQNLDVYLKENGLTFDDVTVERVLADKQLEAAVIDAVQKANDVLGNFSELSPFERQTMRTIFPFWSWMKFINKAAMQLLIDQPDRLVFMAHLGGLTLEEEAEGLWEFLKGKPIVGGAYTDLGFTNPYADAIPFMFTGNQNPLTAAIEETQSISPVLSYPLYALGETAYGFTGRQQPLLPTFSRPGYLEGRPGETTRTLGDTLGGLAYYGLRQFGGPARNVIELSPVDFRVPLTDISVGYAGVPRFPQGSLRTTGQYGVRRLSPGMGRLSAVLRTLGTPAPIVSADVAERASFEAQRTGRDALQRRLKQRRLAQR